jgi:hypothetical protein
MMSMEQSMEWELAGETEVLGENLPQCHFVYHKSKWFDLGSNPDRRGGKPATNRLELWHSPDLLRISPNRFQASLSSLWCPFPNCGFGRFTYLTARRMGKLSVEADTRPSDLGFQAVDCHPFWCPCHVKLQLFILHRKEIEGSDLKSIVETTHRIHRSSFILNAWNHYKMKK